mmetsp:Transcript_2802/g.5173  ORF Transcript_2802/g.5173 Transcript_2802/m.5173 type:complete len:273 (-) Transcript_2802:528-1346(-)
MPPNHLSTHAFTLFTHTNLHSHWRTRHHSFRRTLAVTTNGLLLKRKLPVLVNCNVNKVNISLDSLVPAKFELITRSRGLDRVLEAIDVALAVPQFTVKLNCVVMRGINDDELSDFAKLTRDRDLEVRFIEYMPFDGNRWDDARFLDFQTMRDHIESQVGPLIPVTEGDPNETAKVLRAEGHLGKIGFISSMTNQFCGSCNRVRITADGNIKVCLFDNAEISLRDYMRRGASDEDIAEVARAALRRKAYALGGNRDRHDIARSRNRPMITIGG